MKDFTRGLSVGLLTMLGALCLFTMARADDLPTDLAAVAPNSGGGTIFFSTYNSTKDGVPHGVKCNTGWHVVMSVTGEDKLFGCYTFRDSAVIYIAWADGDTLAYNARLVTLAEWFKKQYPALVPAPSTGKLTRQLHDTTL